MHVVVAGNGIGTAMANRVAYHLGGMADEVVVHDVDSYGALELVTSGNSYSMNQATQDANAAGLNSATVAARACTKAGLAYFNRSDLVDAVQSGLLKLTDAKKDELAGAIAICPPSALQEVWSRRFPDPVSSFASGWMRVRGTRRRKGLDRGFTLSDHADWPALLRTVEDTGARRVLVTHGYSDELARFLAERGMEATALATSFEGEGDLPE